MRIQLMFLLFVLLPRITRSQILTGTDDLGRILPLNNSLGNPKNNKQVGIFYFLWQGDDTAENYWDLSDIVVNHPEVLEDYDNEFWGLPVYKPGGPVGMYYWGKPIYGYYRGDDYWVHLRSIQLLTDEGVDFLVIDATNTLVYPEQSNELMKAMDAVRSQGKKPPRIVYYTNTESGATIQKVYDNFYAPNAPYYHPNCWYYLNGKPLIIGLSKETAGKNYQYFFTYRESQWPTEPKKVNYLTSGIESAPEKAIMVTPNPSSTYFQVQTRNPSDKIVLYDMQGKIVDQKPRKISNNKSNIGSNLHPGIYLLVVTEQNGARQTIKLVKN